MKTIEVVLSIKENRREAMKIVHNIEYSTGITWTRKDIYINVIEKTEPRR